MPPHAAPGLTGHKLRARRLQGLQHEAAHLLHVPGLHKRAAVAGRAPKSILHFTCLPLALTLTARCSSSVRAAPRKGFWKMIMLSMTPCSTSSVHSSRLMNRSVIVPSGGKAGNPTRCRCCAPCHRRCPQGRRGSGSAPRLPSWGCEGTAGCPAASETLGGVLLLGRADGGHVLPRVGQQVDVGARVVVPKGHKRAHEFREGARHGDVVLRHAVRDQGPS